jgi:hypothetical protein
MVPGVPLKSQLSAENPKNWKRKICPTLRFWSEPQRMADALCTARTERLRESTRARIPRKGPLGSGVGVPPAVPLMVKSFPSSCHPGSKMEGRPVPPAAASMEAFIAALSIVSTPAAYSAASFAMVRA